jgi:hypothetical protein
MFCLDHKSWHAVTRLSQCFLYMYIFLGITEDYNIGYEDKVEFIVPLYMGLLKCLLLRFRVWDGYHTHLTVDRARRS